MSHNRYRALNRDGTSNIDRSNARGKAWDMYHRVLSMQAWHFAVWVLGVYIGLNVFFGSLYFVMGSGEFSGLENESGLHLVMDCFFFSVQTFSTIGYGRISPVGVFANLVVSSEAFTGMMSIALMSGLLFARFARPTAKVKFSQKALITQHLGKRCFIFRMANERLNQIAEASVKVTVLKFVKTPEGQEMRIQEDLKLLRDHSAIFAASWLVAHEIDESSPFYQCSFEDMEKVHLEILISVMGYDEIYSQTIYARCSYLYDEIEYDRQYANMVSRQGNKLHVDIDKISDIQHTPA